MQSFRFDNQREKLEAEIDVSMLPRASYFLRIEDGLNTTTKKLILE